MRKGLAIAVLLALTTGSVFAEYNFTFYGRGVFTPFAFSDGDSSVSAATTPTITIQGRGWVLPFWVIMRLKPSA
jgi:hypothetical protein